MIKVLDGILDGVTAPTGPASEPVPFTVRGARPERENALGKTLTDGPYDHFETGGMRTLGIIAATEDGLVFSLEGNSGDLTEDDDWYELMTVTAGTFASLVDFSVPYMRVLYGGASGPCDARVTVTLGK